VASLGTAALITTGVATVSPGAAARAASGASADPASFILTGQS
jgi:hypothetical protein